MFSGAFRRPGSTARAWLGETTAVLRGEKYRPHRYGAALLAAGVSWYVGYDYFTDQIDRSSLLVRQTVFNIKRDERLLRLLGPDVRIASRLHGTMNQRRGHADVRFEVAGAAGAAAAVHVVAERDGWDWNTRHLEVVPAGGAPIVLCGERSGLVG